MDLEKCVEFTATKYSAVYRDFLAAVGLGVSECISQYRMNRTIRVSVVSCMDMGMSHAWIWVCFMHGYGYVSGMDVSAQALPWRMAMARDRGRQCTMRSAFILLVALQLLFSRFISFRVIAYFFRPPTLFLYIHR